MSYTVDVYRGSLSPTRNVLHFFAFLSLFPQLVAGPIVRAGDLLPQLKRVRNVSETERWHGLRLIALGYFKKTVLADNIAPFVNSAFSNDLHNTSSPYWWLVMIGFALQIYFDFSGYSDIARGLAKWMGIHFKVNFNHPYLATSFKNFWSRWHISLSTWFRDYIFIPLGGSRKGTARSYINLWITMLLSGLWHGAGLNYILWGGLHASYLTVEKVTNWPAALSRLKAGKLLAGVIVFLLTTMAWVFFRAPDISTGAYVIQHLFSFTNSGDWGVYDVRFTGIFFICLGVMMEISWALSTRFVRARETTLAIRSFEVVQVSLMVGASIFFRGTGAQFIYFQF
ncbi:MAG TPA: MBOAT family O-acyltransferase [Chryseosolibacter sp.]|nr:MBOAT family O-acyltransferase [Chryseosolibacter sp.]